MLHLRHFVWLLLLVSLWGTPAIADATAALPSGGSARVVSVVDGDTVVLDDGREVRLVGIQAPKLALGRKDFTPWPLGEEAKIYLQSLVEGKAVELRMATQPLDRHGRVLAHLVRVDSGMWVQGEMLVHGLARVYTFADNRLLAAPMLALERQARSDRKGLWNVPFYALRNADNVQHDIDTFQLVEGRVVDAVRIKDRVYLNFAHDWRRDFTVKVSKRDERQFNASGIELLSLKGKKIRVRGWIKSQNGPMIELDHPERLEVIEP